MPQHLPNAAPSPEICERPAPPLDLSMVRNGKEGPVPSAPFALMRTGTPALRKVIQKPLFEALDDKAYLIRPPTQLMRLIDSLRFHKPTPEERAELNLCSSTERLYLHTLSDLLLACGGRKGFRFRSCDINRLRQNCDDVSKKFEALDDAFKSLPLDVTQYKFPAHTQRIEDEPVLYVELANPANYTKARSRDDAIRWRAFHFQKLARDYVNSYARLRETARDVRARFRQYVEGRTVHDKVESLQDAVEAEFEAKAHRPFPVFLHHLIQKYHREQRKQSTEWTSSSPEPPVDSIGVFCVYLSYVLLDDVSLSHDEVHSFEVLLQVLKLSYRVDAKLMRIVDISHPDRPTHAHRANALVTNVTLCMMMYEFLSTVRELRLVSKQKNLLPERRQRRASSASSCS